MSAGIAHEINNPLTIIKGRSRRLLKLLEEGNTEKAKDLVESISKSTDRIDHIVKGLKTYSRQEFDDPFLQLCINEVIEETIRLYQSQVTAQNVALETNFESENIYIDGHPGEISQVILNLLGNAKDAVIENGGGWVRIVVRTSRENAFVDVVNSGDRLDENISNKIFDPFFTTKDVGKGTGLGLSLSRNIVRNHSGDLYFNKNTRNTTFTFSIPLS
jgi:C4-dicarboxylate-specific signal transduction histidine kinase